MNIRTQINLTDKAFEIYLSGCNGNCQGCHNLEFKDFNQGTPLNYRELFNDIQKAKLVVDRIYLLGGDPIDQDPDDLLNLILWLKGGFSYHDLWLWTRYELDQIPSYIKNYCDFIKTGPYIESRPSYKSYYGMTIASDNQKIYKIRGK